MLTLTRKTDYALVALCHLAHCRHAGIGPVSARQIGESYNLPLPLLMNILKDLASAKLVTSTRGATGGYALAIEPKEVGLLEVIHAIEGPVKLTPCCSETTILGEDCTARDNCPIQGAVQNLHRRLNAFFEDITLDQLLTESPAGCCQNQAVALTNESNPTV
jgi:Rrf2 family protein